MNPNNIMNVNDSFMEHSHHHQYNSYYHNNPSNLNPSIVITQPYNQMDSHKYNFSPNAMNNNTNGSNVCNNWYMTPLHSGKHTVHWFRRGLRLHDNPSLREGIRYSTTFRCIFLIDPWFASSNKGINKWR